MSYKLYFKYGVMGCSKTAQALMTKFNYEQKGYNVFLIKPNTDTRDDKDGKTIIKSRIGLKANAYAFPESANLYKIFCKKNAEKKIDVVIVDECQFCKTHHIEELKKITEFVPVLCYGLKTNFKTKLFEGSKRLLELADSLTELKAICECGKKATLNGRFINGKLTIIGEEILIGGDESYRALCYDCFENYKKQKKHIN